MYQEPHAVVQRSRPRRQVVWAAGNLLILIGAVLLGSSILAATRAPDSRPRNSPLSPVHTTAYPAASPTVARQPTATAASSILAVTPAAAQGRFEPRQSTLEPEPDARSPQPWRPGEGLLEPGETVKQSSSPYARNEAGPRVVHISVPAVGIDAEVVEVAPVAVQEGQRTVFEWPVADWAAGHHITSANPGEGGNIVIAGHADVRGEVFRGLHDVQIGDQVIVSTDTAIYTYVVQEIHMRLFNNQPFEEQLSVGVFIGPMPEERLTLVTCWPYQIDTYRLIVVAKPV